MRTAFTKGHCQNCDKEFWYVRYRADKNFCSTKCKNRSYYVNKGSYSERERRTSMSPEEREAHRKEWYAEYLTRPDVRAKRRERYLARYATDDYRLYARNRYHANVHGPSGSDPIVRGYANHKWFDIVEKVVGPPPAEDSLFFDRWADRMGAGVLALLEGRDVAEAVREHNRREYIPNNRQVYISDWEGENEYKQALIGSSPSAEEEAITQSSQPPLIKTRYSNAKNSRRYGSGSHGGRTAPTRREGFEPWQDRPGNRRA